MLFWKTSISEKMEVFFWLATKNKLHIGEMLARKDWNVSSGCYFCGANLESINYLFFHCYFARSLYRIIKLQLSLNGRLSYFFDFRLTGDVK